MSELYGAELLRHMNERDARRSEAYGGWTREIGEQAFDALSTDGITTFGVNPLIKPTMIPNPRETEENTLDDNLNNVRDARRLYETGELIREDAFSGRLQMQPNEIKKLRQKMNLLSRIREMQDDYLATRGVGYDENGKLRLTDCGPEQQQETVRNLPYKAEGIGFLRGMYDDSLNRDGSTKPICFRVPPQAKDARLHTQENFVEKGTPPPDATTDASDRIFDATIGAYWRSNDFFVAKEFGIGSEMETVFIDGQSLEEKYKSRLDSGEDREKVMKQMKLDVAEAMFNGTLSVAVFSTDDLGNAAVQVRSVNADTSVMGLKSRQEYGWFRRAFDWGPFKIKDCKEAVDQRIAENNEKQQTKNKDIAKSLQSTISGRGLANLQRYTALGDAKKPNFHVNNHYEIDDDAPSVEGEDFGGAFSHSDSDNYSDSSSEDFGRGDPHAKHVDNWGAELGGTEPRKVEVQPVASHTSPALPHTPH
jgi:hypothetical protein